MSSQCCLTYVELLSGEKEVVRRWLRDEMTTFLDPLVDTLFNRLEASLMSNGAVPNQFGGGAGCGCGCGQLVMNGNDGQMHQPSFVIGQPTSSHHLNIQQNVQNVHYSYQQPANVPFNDYYLNNQQQLTMTTPFVQPLIAPNVQLNYNDPIGQANPSLYPTTIPHQISPTSPSQLNPQNVIPNYQSPSPSSEPMDLRFNRESSSTEPSVPSSPGSMDNRSSDDQSSTSEQISSPNENVQSFPIQDEVEVTNLTVQPSSSTSFQLNPQYVQSQLISPTSSVPPPLAVSITSGQIALPNDPMISNELTNVQSFQVPIQVPIQHENEVTPTIQPSSSTSFQLNPQYVQSQLTSPTPQVPPPRVSNTNDQQINFPNKLTNIQSHPIRHEILIKTTTVQPTTSTSFHLKHSTPPPNGRKSNPLTARQSLSLVKREPIDEEHDETQLMEDDNPQDRHTIKLNFDFTESMYSDAFDDDEDDQLLKCRHSGCQFQTAHAYQLRTHERTHSGVKPFRCKWPRCDYAAIRKSEVLGHIRRHFALEPSSVPNGTQLDPKDYLEVVHDLL